MKPSQLANYLAFTIQNKFATLVTGKPGIGKSDIVAQAAIKSGAELIIEHPVVSDPTDYKGLPFSNGEVANFLPFKNLRKIIEAKVPTVFFIDDLGQAPASVQAAIMQLLLARQIGEHKVSEHVTFVAATNRKQDKAGVNGILEPVKSRFSSGIIPLEVDINDWVKWALNEGNMPIELISFIRFRPDMLSCDEIPKDMVNVASPRTVAAVGKVQRAGLPQSFELDAFSGIAGQGFAVEYRAFLQMIRTLPNIDNIIANPDSSKLPVGPGANYAVATALANRATQVNIAPIIKYINRVDKEYAVLCMKLAQRKTPEVAETQAFISWATENQNIF